MRMKNPAHPGRIIKDGCLDALGLSVTDAAEVLGVRRTTLSRIINGRSGISADCTENCKAFVLGVGRLQGTPVPYVFPRKTVGARKQMNRKS